MRKTMDSQSLYRKRTSRGLSPEYGAIFMANNSTRKECFERQLFGLPYDHADFVKEIKTGMLLFLYDFQEKNLYGVFEATSDGAMNIVPDAYRKTSPRMFPAQVQFRTFWHCDPISEHAFGDAIKENYYRNFKFNLGLSRDQVRRLLSLYEKRMLKIPSSPLMEQQHQRSSQIRESVVVIHPGSLETSESITKSVEEPLPENLDKVDASDHGIAPQLEDYIPLPSIGPEEIEGPFDAFLWGADTVALWPLAGVDGTDNEEQIDSDTRYGFQEWDSFALLPFAEVEGTDNGEQIDSGTRYDFMGWDSGSSKPASCSSEPKGSIIQQDDREIHDSNDLQVRGLYSDSPKKRTSVFMRLSGVGNMKVEEHHSNNVTDNLRDILKELDTRHKLWKSKSSENALKSRSSVFSRLRSDGRKSLDRESKVRVAKKKSTSHNLKRKSSCSVKTGKKDSDSIPAQSQNKRSRRTDSKSCSKVTKTCSRIFMVPDLSEGSSVCT